MFFPVVKEAFRFFATLQVMDEKDHIDQLKKELVELHKELFQYHEKMLKLQQRIARLENVEGKAVNPVESKKTIQNFSLENFIGLRLIHFVGIVILVIGLSIGVKYAIDRNFISEGMRIALAYAAGIVLYVLSLWLRTNYKSFSAILFSGGMASLYFTTYAAFVYYHIVSFSVAFIIMILLTLYTMYEAIKYNRQEIALLGLVGAYAIPFLISQNSERAELLFFYISIINAAVVFLSIMKNLKLVVRVAQVIIWVIFIGWAAMRFSVAMQWVGFSFMAFFFILFLFSTVSVKLFQKQNLSPTDTYFLLLNNVALYISVLFIFGYSFVDANVSTVSFFVSAVIALQAMAIHFFCPGEVFAKNCLGVLSLLLFIVFIAFGWDGLSVTLLWLLTAVIVFSVGAARRSVFLRMQGILLMGLTLLKLLLLDSNHFSPIQKVISYLVLGVLLLLVSFFYQKFKKRLFGE